MLRRFDVFAVEDTTAQAVWGHLDAGPVRVRAGDAVVDTEHPGGPGAVVVGALPPDHDLDVVLERPGRVGELARRRVRTLPAPPGRQLCRIATVNDLHIGARGFGLLPRVSEPDAEGDRHPVRCARAAIAEALAWGADIVLVKGDLTEESTPEAWQVLSDLLTRVPVPVLVVPGNHDVGTKARVPAQTGATEAGLRLVHGVVVRDLPGVRVIVADTAIPGMGHGRIAHVGDLVVRAAARAPGGVLLALHHHPMAHRLPTFWPPGIPGPEADRFLRRLAEANPATLVTTGHTHRHRRHRRRSLTVTEVGSTKDYPGVWAGYAVHEGGIRQVVRRVAAPDALSWTERTRRSVGGVWGLWSPGAVDDRCFTLAWPARGRATEPAPSR